MADAEVGDDVLDGDPTVRRLEERVCELLGKERALFFPTGTMANVAALWLLAKRGTEVLLDGASHIMDLEHAAAAALVGVQTRPVALGAGRLVLDADAITDALAVHAERASLVCLENTHNGAGGVVTSAAQLDAIGAAVRRHGLPLHLDGARLWNAAVTACTSEERLSAAADTVMVSFAKGLGAPVGAALAGPAALMADAIAVRRRLGGGMRQSGVIAAAALYGVTHNRARLAEDHERAEQFACAVDGAGGARVVSPETNIVMIDLPRPAATDAARRAAALGVRLSVWTPTRLRAVTHLDVDDDAVRRAAEIMARVLEAVPAA